MTPHPWPAALAACVLAAVAGCRPPASEAQADAPHADEKKPAVTVRVEPAALRTLDENVDGLGRCEALPGRIATLTPAVEGRVRAIRVAPGATVEAGQAIVELDPQVAAADLQEKITTRDGLEASLRLLQSLPRPQEQEGKKLAIESAKVALAKAESVVARLRPLRERNEIPQQQMYEAESAVTQARLQLQTAQSELTTLLLGPRPAAVEEAKAHIAAAAAQVRSAEAKLELHTIRAPIAGVLDGLTCRPGQTLAAGSGLGEIVDARQVYAAVWLPVGVARRVALEQPAVVRRGGPDARPTADDEPLAGKVALLQHVADPQTGNIQVRVLVDNPRAALVVGETLSATIRVARHEKRLAVPDAALNDLGEGPLVYVVRDGKAVVLHATLGYKDAGWTEVRDTDLKPGEPVIVEGGYNLPAGTAVRVSDPP